MELTQLADIGEFVGGIAVIASLFYVGQQIRQTRTVLIRAAERDWHRDNTAAVHFAGRDEKMAEVWLQGMSDFAGLGPEDAWRFETALYSWLASFEMAYLDRRKGLGDPETAVVHRDTVAQIMRLPGPTVWWEQRKNWFAASFQEEVERIRSADSDSLGALVRGQG